jgi:DNA-binding PadR family transcriptional regulator
VVVLNLNKEILKGNIDLLLLALLLNKDSYGYEMAKQIKLKSGGDYEIGEGTLYPALKRLESNEYIESFWIVLENLTKRKYYKITDAGKKELEKRFCELQKITNLINSFMEEK